MSEIWNLSTLCRCCHADGYFKSLNLSYQGKNDVEIYEIMLRETLGITISTPPLEVSYTICDKCISKLRDATDFKNQVLMCEQKFKVYCNNEQFLSNVDVKLEEAASNDDGLDHDDVPQMDEALPLDVKKEYTIEVDIKHPIEELKNDNQPKTEKNVVIPENIIIEDETDKKLEVPKTNINNSRNRRRQPCSNKIKRKPTINLDRSLIIQVDTDAGTQYSCKDCGGCYHTQKEINRHIYEAHAMSFKCEYCPKQLKSHSTYKKHLELHSGKELPCPFCPKTFAAKYALKDHLYSHRERIFQCDLCKKYFKSKQTLKRHLRVHAGTNKRKLCDLCGKSFNDISNLNAHVSSVHQKLRPYQCKLCGKSYSSQRHLRDHLQIHVGDDKLYKCDVCDHRLSCRKSMKIHKLKHENKFVCKYCSKVFDDPILKKEHVKEMHHSDHTCPICGKVLAGKFSLNRHINDHKGIKKFPCDLCELKFSQKIVLERHIFRMHNPEGNINIEKTKCDICKRSFKNIIAHKANHEMVKKFSCEICGKSYPNNSALNRHKSMKHYDRTFDCDLCGKKYLQKGKLNTHKLKIHKIKIEKVNADSS